MNIEFRNAYEKNLKHIVFKEVKHGLHFTERSGVKGETVA